MHPLLATHDVCEKKEKQEEHVPRHIEVTAVLTEMLKQKHKSNRIERFE